MPQAFYQVRQSGEFAGSMVAFYPDYIALEQAFSTITPTWNHLWYLVYLWLYTMLLIPLGKFIDGPGKIFAVALKRRDYVQFFIP